MLILKLVVIVYLIDRKYVHFVIITLTVAVNSDLEWTLFYIWRKIAASITYRVASPNTRLQHVLPSKDSDECENSY